MQASLEDLSLVLGEVAIFRGLPAAVTAEVARSVQILSLPKGAPVYAAGERPKALYHVMSGHLKVAVSSPEGGEKVIEILSPNQLFGVAELFGDASYVSSVETVSPVVALAIGRDAVLRAIEQDPCVSRRMLAALAQRQSSIEREIAADCFQSGSAKVVDYLCRLAGPSLGAGLHPRDPVADLPRACRRRRHPRARQAGDPLPGLLPPPLHRAASRGGSRRQAEPQQPVRKAGPVGRLRRVCLSLSFNFSSEVP